MRISVDELNCCVKRNRLTRPTEIKIVTKERFTLSGQSLLSKMNEKALSSAALSRLVKHGIAYLIL